MYTFTTLSYPLYTYLPAYMYHLNYEKVGSKELLRLSVIFRDTCIFANNVKKSFVILS